jgi:ribosome-binding factor A
MSRLLKVASLLKKEIASILLTRVNNNKIGFITITEVTVAKDFSTAKVSYSQLGSEKEIQETKKALSSASKFIHFELCKAIKYMKTIPRLIFMYDDRIERGVQMVNKMKGLIK